MKNLFVLGIFSLALCLFCSCDSDKNEPSSGNHGASKGEWYTSGFTTSSDFKEINQAIDDHELLYSSKYGGDQYAESWAFFADHPDGSYSTVKPHWGRLRFIPTIQHASVYHIVDDTTIEDYLLFMYPIEANVGPTFRIVDAGSLIIGLTYKILQDVKSRLFAPGPVARPEGIRQQGRATYPNRRPYGQVVGPNLAAGMGREVL